MVGCVLSQLKLSAFSTAKNLELIGLYPIDKSLVISCYYSSMYILDCLNLSHRLCIWLSYLYLFMEPCRTKIIKNAYFYK